MTTRCDVDGDGRFFSYRNAVNLDGTPNSSATNCGGVQVYLSTKDTFFTFVPGECW